MAQLLNNLFGGPKEAAKPAKGGDSDFADFANPPDPQPLFSANSPTLGGSGPAITARPYTKWYNVHERHTLSEFYAEGFIIIGIAVVLVVHVIGARLNRAKAKKWMRANSSVLSSEFALVGFEGVPAIASDKAGDALLQTLSESNTAQGDAAIKEKSLFEYAAYATGRQNVAFVDVKLTLFKRFNPFWLIVEFALGLFIEAYGSPEETAEAILYPFDGKEGQTVPGIPGAAELKGKESKSTFDGFVWAIVNKEKMKQVREDRYDLSLTFTKDNSKLPNWATVMSESAEITDFLLTPELVKAIESAGELFDYLIISDQPTEKPTTLNETNPRKRIFLKYRLPSNNSYENLVPIFSYFVRVSDQLAQSAHFRPEVMRKVKLIREEQIKAIKKEAEVEKADERALEREKAKKAKRDQELSGLDAKAQKKYLEKEREKEMRKAVKKQSTRG